jgi:predicted adenine nucleotide alpha hydrolase (AANH) superfamily ATPase
VRSVIQNKKILLHVCCAPCASASIERLLRDNWGVTLFFSNSNIYPQEEFEKRFLYVQKLSRYYDVPVFAALYEHSKWLDCVQGLEHEPEQGARCAKCFEFNLGAAAAEARKMGIEAWTTSLTISPLKKSPQIFSCGANFPGFEAYDFKKQNGYARSIEIAKQLDLYRQNYCGCEFSKKH